MAAYFHLSRIARKYNTEHLELITSLYAEKMNDSMEYLQNYVQEDVKMIQSMEGETPEKILERLQKNLNQQALESEQSFNSDPYQSSQTGNMIMTVFCPGEGFLADSQSVCVYYDREPQTAGSL